MPRAAYAITRFNAGKLSPQVGARVDQSIRPYYDAGAQVMTDFLPLVEGPMTKRGGFQFVKPVKDSTKGVRLIPFATSIDDAYVFEFGDTEVHLLRDGGGVTRTTRTITAAPTAANPVEITVGTAHGTGDVVFIEGTGMDEINGRYFVVTQTSGTTFTLDGEDGTGRSTSNTGGSASDVVKNNALVPYGHDELWDLSWEQANELLYMTHPDYEPRTFTLTGSPISAVDIDTIDYDWPAFEFDSVSGETMQASASTGTITLTASSAIFETAHIGRFVRLTDPTSGIGPLADGGGEGYVSISGVSSPPSTTATAVVVKELDPQVVSSATTRWAWDAWNDANGFPSVVAFIDDRIVFGGVQSFPNQIWASRLGIHHDFSRLDSDEGGLHFRIQGGGANPVEWMEQVDETLIIGTRGSEWTLGSADSVTAIASGNINAKRRSDFGSRENVKPVVVNNLVLFAQRAGRKLRSFQYRIQTNEMGSDDLTRLSREITVGNIKELTYQQEPNRLVWTMLEDGGLVVLTFEPDEQVIGWSDIAPGGSGLVRSICAIPSSDDTTDEFWAVIERTINGSTVKHVEQLQPFWARGTDIEDSVFLDSAILYDGSPATSFAGANHLEGETVSVLADGGIRDDVTIVDGTFTLDTAASKVVVGFPYTAQYLSMPIEAGAADGTSQGKRGSTMRLMLRLDQTGEAIEYGPSLDDLRSVALRTPQDPMDAPAPLFDGDKADLIFPMNQRTRQEIAIQHADPLPCTVVGIFPRLEAR